MGVRESGFSRTRGSGLAEGCDGVVEGAGDGDALGGGAEAGRVAAVGGEAGALLLEDAGEQGLGVADGVAADAALRWIDGEHQLAAPGGPPSPGSISLTARLSRLPSSCYGAVTMLCSSSEAAPRTDETCSKPPHLSRTRGAPCW